MALTAVLEHKQHPTQQFNTVNTFINSGYYDYTHTHIQVKSYIWTEKTGVLVQISYSTI